MNGRQDLISRSRAQWRNPGIAGSDHFYRTVGQPKQVEGLRIVAACEAVRGLRDDRNAILKAGILSGIGLKIGRERAQLLCDDVANEVFRRLTVKCWICKRRIRKREIAESALKPALERGLEGVGRKTSLRESLRLQALEERHQIAEQADELLDFGRRRL
ncbi:hypothetical protein [Bradyrhizobium sp. I1.14.4]|uniref:hypothetical protein n=1 Tax=unclassified Bradyrhizobium TaxID=2631580 RepID=UPI003D2356CC